ncbi:MAG TPA: hypothetical protein VIL37_17310 [Natronosporangium sp.]
MGGIADEIRAAAHRLGRHPQDHGWRDLYRLFAYGLARPAAAPRLTSIATAAHHRLPTRSAVHLVTLLGIAVKLFAGAAIYDLTGDRPPADRLAALEDLLGRYHHPVEAVLAQRQNSFTGARRFLVPQVLLAAYFAGRDRPVRFADLGTGLGVLPRQLNARTAFEEFRYDLAWPDGYPVYQPIPALAARYGVDRGPFPDLSWVRSCYGPSSYYAERFQELVDTLALPEVADAAVRYHELDFTDLPTLRRFLTEHRINAANLCYTLYEVEPRQRAAIIDTVVASLTAPGLLVVTEPHADLTEPGCSVTVWEAGQPHPRPLCSVSHGHFHGRITPLAGYREFVQQYPIRFEEDAGAVDADAHPRDHAA